MASTQYNIKVLKELIKGKISKEEIIELLPKLKLDVDDFDEDYIYVDVTPDRPDLFSEEGVSKLINFYKGFKKPYVFNVQNNSDDYKILVSKENAIYRPFTSALVVKDLKLDEDKLKTIINVQEKLHITTGRKRTKLAIGIYPLDKVKFPVNFVSMKPKKISFIPLGETKEMNGNQILKNHPVGKEYAHLLEGLDKYPIFIDTQDNYLSMPPIINSDFSGKVLTSTKDLFIECSGFDMKTNDYVVNMLATIFYDMGAKIYPVKVCYPKYYKKEINSDLAKNSFLIQQSTLIDSKDFLIDLCPKTNSVDFNIDYSFINKLLGENLSKNEIDKYLLLSGIKVTKGVAKIPCYRYDILNSADLAEEVLISSGLENIVPENLNLYSFGKAHPIYEFEKDINSFLMGMGFQPIKNYSLVYGQEHKEFVDIEKIVPISHPANKEYDYMRYYIFPQLLEIFNYNRSKEFPQKIFEFGEVFELINKEPFEHLEKEKLSIAMAGNYTFTDIKQVIDNLMKSYNIDYQTKETDLDFLIEGRNSLIIFKDKVIGFFGELKLNHIINYNLNVPVIVAEIDIEEFYDLATQ